MTTIENPEGIKKTDTPQPKVEYLLTEDKKGHKIAFKVSAKTGKKKRINYKLAQKRHRDLKYRRKKQAEEFKAWSLIKKDVLERKGTRKEAIKVYHKSRKRGYTPKKSAEYAARHTGEEVIYKAFYQFSEKEDGIFYDPFEVGQSPGRDEYTDEHIPDRPGVGYQSVYIHGKYGEFDTFVDEADDLFNYYLKGHKGGNIILHYGGYQVSYVDKRTGYDLIPPESKQFYAKGIDHDSRMLDDME